MAVILIVEDEIFIRQSAEWAMEDLGHGVLVAGDLGEAIVHLSAPAPIDASTYGDDVTLEATPVPPIATTRLVALLWPTWKAAAMFE